MPDITKILKEHGLSEYISLLKENRIDTDVLRDVTDDHLKAMGIPVGDRIRIMKLARSGQADPQAGRSTIPSERSPDETSEIRQITVLFADLVGSTELAAHFDVEEYHFVLARFHERCSEIVRTCGGMPARFIGDALLACFGYPHATENDAARAVRAAEQIAADIPKLRVGIDYTPRARVGVATGLAMTGNLMGEGRESFGPATGATLNLAARLQSLATPDTVLIDQTTKELLASGTPCAFAGEHVLKGFAEALPVWKLEDRSANFPPPEASHLNDVVPLIGREPELATIQRHWQESHHKGSIVLISGEAGIGKTRTLNEFVRRANVPNKRIVRMECQANDQLRPLRPVIAALESLAECAHFSDPQTRAAKLVEWIFEDLKLSPATAAAIARLVAPPRDSSPEPPRSPHDRKAEIFDTLTLLIDRMGLDGPNLFVIEDIHWIDPTTREFLDTLAERIGSMKAMCVCTYRPDHQPNFIGRKRVSLISLSRLEDEQSAELMLSVLRGAPLPPDISSEIIARAEGIPFFVEELTKSAEEAGAADHRTGRSLRLGNLPTTLHGSLLARLDRVPGASRLAPVGAAIGRSFPERLMLEVAGLTQTGARPILEGLVATGLLIRHGTADQCTYTFKHALVRDAAYEIMPKSRRRKVHLQIARLLESGPPCSAAAPETLARHFSEAQDHEKACTYWHQAAVASQNATSSTEAVAHFKSALDANRNTADELEKRRREIEIRTALYVPLQVANWGSGEILHNMERLRELRAQEGLGDELLDILHALSGYHIIQGEVTAARRYADELMATYAAKDAVAHVLGLRSLGFCDFLAGEFESAIGRLRKAIALCRHIDEERIKKFYQPDTTLICHGLIAWSYALQDCPDAMEEEIRIALPMVEQRPRKWTRAYALTLIASAYQVAGNFDLCDRYSRQALAYAEEVKSEYWISWNEVLQGWVAAARNSDRNGVGKIRSGIERYRATGSLQCVRYQTCLLADAELRLGNLEETRRILAGFEQLEPADVLYVSSRLDELSLKSNSIAGG